MLKACYSDRYFAFTHSKSMEKLAEVAKKLECYQIAEIVEPDIIDPELLRQLHNPNLVNAFMKGEMPLAVLQGFKSWNKQLRDAVLTIHGGQLLGAHIALKDGIAANIAQGFHHANYDYGSGFCTFNGLALVAQENANKRVFVLDCDQHGGNGTAEFAERLPNLFNYTIYGLRYGHQDNEKSIGHLIDRDTGTFEQYKQFLLEGFEHILAWKTDLLIYQAGVDCHHKDPFGSQWCTNNTLYLRDKIVFDFAQKHNIPLLFVLAGGYQELNNLVTLHINTFIAANSVYFPHVINPSIYL